MAFYTLFILSCAVLCSALRFKTEQGFLPEDFNISHVTPDKSLLAPGYIFMGPLNIAHAWGPQIYEQDGTLVFSGGHRRIQDFTRCDYLGEHQNHLCFHQSRFQPGSDPRIQKRDNAPRPVGKKLIFDNTYRQVGRNYTKGIGTGKQHNWPNGHEYNMLKGGESFLQAVYYPKPWDLRQYTGRKDGWVLDGCFQEISVRTGDVIFQWCFSDHVELWEAQLYFLSDSQKNATSGKAGFGNEHNPWDFVHLNAVDKNEEGDYIVSGRHLDEILKVAGPDNVHGLEPGSIIWRVGGRSNDFEMEDGLLFTKQHDVRVVSTTAEETTLSFFNNAWEGTNKPSAERSAGMIIAVNNVTMKARLLNEYPHPDGLLGRAMGSMQVLPNGNALVGWGASPQITEFHNNGTVLWHAWYALPNWEEREKKGDQHEWTYRAFKYTWEATPYWDPKMIAYARTCSKANPSPLTAWVSWNGATGVAKWRFHVALSKDGPWLPAGTSVKNGFETKHRLSGPWRQEVAEFMPWVRAEALGPDDQVLAHTVRKTFVPNPGLSAHCNDNGCYNGPRTFHYPESLSCSWACERSEIVSCIVLALVLLFVESVYFWTGNFCRKSVNLEMDGNFKAAWRGVRSGEAFRDARYRVLGKSFKDDETWDAKQAPGRRKSLESQTEPLRDSVDGLGAGEK